MHRRLFGTRAPRVNTQIRFTTSLLSNLTNSLSKICQVTLSQVNTQGEVRLRAELEVMVGRPVKFSDLACFSVSNTSCNFILNKLDLISTTANAPSAKYVSTSSNVSDGVSSLSIALSSYPVQLPWLFQTSPRCNVSWGDKTQARNLLQNNSRLCLTLTEAFCAFGLPCSASSTPANFLK